MLLSLTEAGSLSARAVCVLGQNVAATAVIGVGCRIQNNVPINDGVALR